MWGFLFLYNRSLFGYCLAKAHTAYELCEKMLILSYSKYAMSIVTAYDSKPFSGTCLSVYILDKWEKNHCIFWFLIQSQCITLNSYLGDLSSVVVL